MSLTSIALVLSLLASPSIIDVDERPGQAGEWGFRPADGSRVERTPPPFSWRPQAAARHYELQVSMDPSFQRVDYAARAITWNVHCPTQSFAGGAWAWRFRFVDAQGATSNWSSVRHFEVPDGAATFVLPPRGELVERIPDAHPRLFLRPEDLPGLRASANGPEEASFQRLIARCDRFLAEPPSTVEPQLYPPGLKRGSEEWRELWWGNRTKTRAVLEASATLAFTWRLSEHAEYGELAHRLLMDAAQWDPKGATGFRYNDEAGMPYAYQFSRTYTLLYPLLSEEDRAKCRAVMRVRGGEMFAVLAPTHLWKPYGSHANRAWHFLGEVGIAFHGEIPEADDWTWFAANVFANVYPVWADEDGGWHEGMVYWRSYLDRFTTWADVQRAALGLDAYALPYFSRAGDFPLYVTPPGTKGGGFGDLNASRRPEENRKLMTTLANQSGNAIWRWYVEAVGGPDYGGDWIGFLRGAGADVEPEAPDSLPTARVFRGTGIAVLQSSLLSAKDNVEVIFKSSPFGSQSHGYEAQNSFLLYAFGERLLIRSGKRDTYGSRHHREWMWQTKSTNNITVNGRGQPPRTAAVTGEITGFLTEPGAHWVEGEAGDTYGEALSRYRREILFLEPDLIVIRDSLVAQRPATFEWKLHASNAFQESEEGIIVHSGEAVCRINFMAPIDLPWTQTDRFDPPPVERVQLTEHHLTATTGEATLEATFITVIRPYRKGSAPPGAARMEGNRLVAPLGGGSASVEFAEDGTLRATVSDGTGTRLVELDTAQNKL